MTDERPDAILIAGPTAAGKSVLALDFAEKFDGEIINADAMQVYRDLAILTARPGKDELARVPHHLYGHIGAEWRYSAGQWLIELEPLLEDLRARGKMPVITGGSGLYFRALLHGLAPLPEIPEKVRQYWRERLAREGAVLLHRVLAEKNSQEAERLQPGDGQRVVRALEVIEATGETLGQWHKRADDISSPLAAARLLKLLLDPDREALYQRIDERFDDMISLGVLEEVQQLLARGLPDNLPAMKAIGVKALGRFLNEEIDGDEAIRQAKRESRNYAKRQYTWARNQMSDWQIWQG